jgi:hypothetical protein
MHRYSDGSRVLSSGGVHHYVEVGDSDYDPIRTMAGASASISL